MPRTLHEQAEDRIRDDAYEVASEDGYIRWYGHTMLEPGYWSDDLDIDIEYKPVLDEDTNEPLENEETAYVVVKLNRTTIFERIYELSLDPNGYLYTYHEDV